MAAGGHWQDGERPPSLRLLSWNIHKCLGTDGRRDPARILSVIAGLAPDVAVLQEADRKVGRNRGLFGADEVMSETGMRLWTPGPAAKGEAGWHGNALFARSDIECLAVRTIRLPSLEPRGAVIWSLSAGGLGFDVIGMHLALLGAVRRVQAASIAAVIASRPPVPTIVAGDSNDWHVGSPAMRPLEEVLGTRSTRLRTFPARMPMLSLDRVMAGRGAEAVRLTAQAAGKASDHLPVMAEIRLPS